MTAFAVNSGGVVNWDTLSGGSVNATLDTYAISNGSTLLINTDSYQCANHSTAFGSLDTVSFSGIGGKLKIDGTSVRVIPYNTGTGTVPAVGTTITQGGASATFLGVWSSWLVEPTASGAAMPVTGFIKVRGVTGAFAAGALTGISASATGPDVVGWIEVRGTDTATITVPRTGAFEVVGDWFELGTTNGTRGQVLACPTTATVASVFPGVWIETAPGSGVYDRFNSVGSLAANANTHTDSRAMVFWQTTSGIRIGSDGTNNVGYLPPSGCKVRIPNVILTCCTRTVSGSGPRVLPNATLGTRQEFVTTASGTIDVSHCVFQWYGNFLQAYRANVSNAAFCDTLILQEIASILAVSNCIVSPTQSQINNALWAQSCFKSGIISDCNFARISLAVNGTYVSSLTSCIGVTLQNVKSIALTNRAGVTTGAFQINQCNNVTLNGCHAIGGRVFVVSATGITILSQLYSDLFSGTTGTSLPHSAVDFSTGCSDCLVSGVSIIGTNAQPYNALVLLNGVRGVRVRNIGTPASPIDLGSVNACNYIVQSVGNNSLVKIQRCYAINTRTGPWLLVNDDIGVTIENCSGDYAASVAVPSNETTTRSVALSSPTAGQLAVYGTHWRSGFFSATTGRVEVLCNEPSTSTTDECTFSGGAFNSSGQIALTSVGHTATWTMKYFALGHTALANSPPTRTGTNTGNLDYEFQIDTGSGFGAWQSLTAANLSAVSITPTTGFRLKIRATCTVANAGNLLTNISVHTTTTASAQNDNLYPLDRYDLQIIGIQSGSDVVILRSGAIVAQADQISGTTYDYEFYGAETVDIGVLKAGFVPLYFRNFSLPASDYILPVAQQADRNYV